MACHTLLMSLRSISPGYLNPLSVRRSATTPSPSTVRVAIYDTGDLEVCPHPRCLAAVERCRKAFERANSGSCTIYHVERDLLPRNVTWDSIEAARATEPVTIRPISAGFVDPDSVIRSASAESPTTLPFIVYDNGVARVCPNPFCLGTVERTRAAFAQISDGTRMEYHVERRMIPQSMTQRPCG